MSFAVMTRFAGFISICLILIEAVLTEDVEPTFKYTTVYNKEGRFMTKDDIEKASVNVLKPIIFIIGGLTDADKKGDFWSNDLRDAYLEKLVHNVFIVDWNIISPPQPLTLKQANSAGLAVADFIARIFNKTGEAYLDIHLVGISLGSEVAASAALRLFETSGRKINRITGLDPAYYLISGGEARKLSAENADFVDVVLTNFNETDGGLQAWGHVDFYVDVENKNNSGPKSVEIFAKSVNSNDIKAVKCDNLERYKSGACNDGEEVTFGENVNTNARGKYFLKS